MLSELCAGTMAMCDVLGISKEPRFKEFKIFLNIMEVYGGGYKDDIDYSRFNARQRVTHHESMITQLEKLIFAYELTLSAYQKERLQEFESLVIVLNWQRAMFMKLLAIQESKKNTAVKDFQPEGHLVYFTCGHRG